MGKLTNPDTWQKWDKAHGNKLDAAISKYRKWYKKGQNNHDDLVISVAMACQAMKQAKYYVDI